MNGGHGPRAAARAGLLAALLVGGAVARAQDTAAQPAMLRVEVVVTAVSGAGIYLDKGRAANIEPGDAVVIYPRGAANAVGVVQAVSRTSSRAELPQGAPAVAIGDRGEVLVPAARTSEPPAAATVEEPSGDEPAAAPDHPPWSEGAAAFDPDGPLLGSGQSGPGPMSVYGRWFTQFNGTWDTENDNAFELVRTGLDLSVENPYGQGGLFHMAGDVFRRTSDVSGGADDQTTDGRLDRFSYRWGGTRQEPDRYEAGRFLQHEFPELGVLDGVEASQLTTAGDRVGASVGYMPLPFPSMRTGQDLQAAVFWRTGSETGRREPYEIGVAYQNTWHEGSQDRNLFLGTFDADLSDDVSVNAEAAVDYYGPGGDTIYGDGLRITDARARTQWRLAPDTGLGLHASKTRWPEMKRHEFTELTPQQIADSAVSRVGADGWHDVGEHLRLDGRIDAWQDDDDSGGSGSVRAALRDTLWERGQVAMDLFTTHGTNTEGHGVRLSASRAFETLGYGTLSWELSSFGSGTSFDGEQDTSQQALRASLDTTLDARWSLSLYGERRSGDDQASFNLGVSLQERF